MANVAALALLWGHVVYAQALQKEPKAYQIALPGSTLAIPMVPIPAGSFTLGSPVGQQGAQPMEQPQVPLTVPAFYMSATEITRDAFDVYYNSASLSANIDADAVTRPSPQYIDFSLGMGKEGGYPANSMSQYTALMYCRWLYEQTGVFYRLPTEAEWEYACRAGTNTPWYFGADSSQLGQYAWYAANSQNKFQQVGLKKPNAWGLYDMLGNVMEWTMDHFEENRYAALSHTTEAPLPYYQQARYPKALRGGSFTSTALQLRSAQRFASHPNWNRRDPQIPKSKWWLTEAKDVGFRIMAPAQQPTAEEANAFYNQYLGK